MSLQPEERLQVYLVRRFRDVLDPGVLFRAVEHGTLAAGDSLQRTRAWARLLNKGVQPGIVDLHFWWSPRSYLAIELKWGGNKPTDAQLAFMSAIRTAGFIAEPAWSAAEVEAIMRRACVPFRGVLSDIDARLAIEQPIKPGRKPPAKPRALPTSARNLAAYRRANARGLF